MDRLGYQTVEEAMEENYESKRTKLNFFDLKQLF